MGPMAECVPSLTWNLPHGVRVAFSQIDDGDQHDAEARTRYLRRIGCDRACAYAVQVHGCAVAQAQPSAPPPRADGLVSVDRDIALMAFGADCPGLCLVASDALGIAHCGWRGTAAGMVGALVEAIAGISSEPRRQWSALIGPAIHGADYEVDEPVLSARDWPRSALLPVRPGHCLLDLRTAMSFDLEEAGIGDVMVVDVSTSRDPRLWSYRQRGAGMVQGLVIWRT